MTNEEAVKHYDYISYLFALQKRQIWVSRLAALIVIGSLFGVSFVALSNVWLSALAAIFGYLINRSWSASADNAIALELIKLSYYQPVAHRCADIDDKNGDRTMRAHLSEMPLHELKLSLAL